ncbi:MAG TPA: hypothetical protein VJN70_13520, partial [Gemmatimonadaceae bacterium]|nr:hypothetical protein [Gemmatimonadaceae bacterium]
PEVTEAAMATLGGAVAVSRQLPDEVGAALLTAADDAFLRGLVLCSAISGTGSLVLAAFAATRFRGVGVAPQRTGEHEVGAVA